MFKITRRSLSFAGKVRSTVHGTIDLAAPGAVRRSLATTNTRTSNYTIPYLAVALGSGISGALGYYLARNSVASASDSLSEPQYGSLADFDSAIKDLRVLFSSEDSVTTAPEDLHDHGFSLNDYHPGSPSFKCTVCMH